MNQVLTQEEIDALLKGISEGDVATEAEPEPQVVAAQVETFDFAKLTRGKKERLPALQFVYDRFSKAFASALTLFIEREVEVNVAPIQHVEYKDLIKTLPLPTNMNIVTMENPKGFYIVIFDAKLIFSVLETMFGSSKISAPKIEGREFTRIEVKVIKKLIDMVATEMEKAWAPVYPMSCRYSRSEMNPNYVTMIAPEEIVSLCDFTIVVEEVASWMKVWVPYAILEPIKSSLMSTPSREDKEMRERWRGQVRQRIMDVPIELRAILARRRISLEDFMKLKEDSIIMMERHINDPVVVEIDNRQRVTGKLGLYKGNKAVKVEDVLN